MFSTLVYHWNVILTNINPYFHTCEERAYEQLRPGQHHGEGWFLQFKVALLLKNRARDDCDWQGGEIAAWTSHFTLKSLYHSPKIYINSGWKKNFTEFWGVFLVQRVCLS